MSREEFDSAGKRAVNVSDGEGECPSLGVLGQADALEREYELAIERLMARVATAGANTLAPSTTEARGFDARGKGKQERDRRWNRRIRAPETRDQLTAMREVANEAAVNSISAYVRARRRSARFSLLPALCVFLGVLSLMPLLINLHLVVVCFGLSILILNGFIIRNRLKVLRSLRKRDPRPFTDPRPAADPSLREATHFAAKADLEAQQDDVLR